MPRRAAAYKRRAGAAAPAASAATPVDAAAAEVLSKLEAAQAAGEIGDAGSDEIDLLLEQLNTVANDDSASPLADPDRLFGRAAALLAASSPRDVAAGGAAVLSCVVRDAPARLAQAVAAQDALLPVLIQDCARKGVSNASAVLLTLFMHSQELAKRARSLGALDALLRRLAALPTNGDNSEKDANSLLDTITELCRQTAQTNDERRAFAEAPGLAEQLARWLRRGGASPLTRVNAARLLGDMLDSSEAAAAAGDAVFSHPGVLECVAELVVDAAEYDHEIYFFIAGAAAAAARWAEPSQLAAMADAPGFLEGLERMLSARWAPEAYEADALPCVCCFFYRTSTDLALVLRALIAPLPTRRLFEARLRLSGALMERARLVTEWMETDPDDDVTTKALSELMSGLTEASNSLLCVTEADLMGDGGGGTTALAKAAAAAATAAATAAAPPAAATAKAPRRRRCFACGREDGASGSSDGGVRLLQCRGCKGTGLKAFFCDRACQKVGWKAHKPACQAAAAAAAKGLCCFACGREHGGGGGGGISGSGGGAALLQCGGCKLAGLKVFFCDRACLEVGWTAHKPACEAVRQQRQQLKSGGSGGSGSGGSGSGGGGVAAA